MKKARETLNDNEDQRQLKNHHLEFKVNVDVYKDLSQQLALLAVLVLEQHARLIVDLDQELMHKMDLIRKDINIKKLNSILS